MVGQSYIPAAPVTKHQIDYFVSLMLVAPVGINHTVNCFFSIIKGNVDPRTNLFSFSGLRVL